MRCWKIIVFSKQRQFHSDAGPTTLPAPPSHRWRGCIPLSKTLTSSGPRPSDVVLTSRQRSAMTSSHCLMAASVSRHVTPFTPSAATARHSCATAAARGDLHPWASTPLTVVSLVRAAGRAIGVQLKVFFLSCLHSLMYFFFALFLSLMSSLFAHLLSFLPFFPFLFLEDFFVIFTIL